MSRRCDLDPETLRRQVLGLGDTPGRKSHYASLRQRLGELERFRAAVDVAADLVFVLEVPSGRILHVNQTACRRLGRAREEMSRLDIDDLLSSASAERLRRRLVGHPERDSSDQGTLVGELRSADGQGLIVEITVQAGEVNGDPFLVLAARDIGERLRAEDEHRRLEGQLRQAQKMEAIGRLAGGIAHDFNNLLTIITGYGEMLLDELGEEDGRRASAQQIVQAGAQAASLTSQLLAFGRRQMLQPVVLDLNGLIAEALRMLRRVIGEDVQLTTRFDPAAGRVRADPSRMQQVLLNLAINARDAMPSGGTLSIVTSALDLDRERSAAFPGVTGQWAALAVADSGVGMDDETRARVFEPFFTTKETGKGTGLGLATVYGIVHQSGGHIAVTSAPGAGTTFDILLPRTDQPVSGSEAEQRGELVRGDETILVVEDQAEVRRLAVSILQRLGYTTLQAANGDEALRAAAAHRRVDLVVTDLVMPGISGVELASRLRESAPELPVLFMSGYADRSVVELAFALPGAGFLQKPFTAWALATRVRAVLDR